MATALQQYHGVGRRKTSVARAWLRPGTGVWEVNGRSLEEYFPRLAHQQHVQEPLIATQNQGRFDIKLKLTGGGLTGQAGAARLAIARALLELDSDLRGVLRVRGLLTRDPRQVERKKPGRPKARKRFQFSKR